jgi:hypothetical protein
MRNHVGVTRRVMNRRTTKDPGLDQDELMERYERVRVEGAVLRERCRAGGIPVPPVPGLGGDLFSDLAAIEAHRNELVAALEAPTATPKTAPTPPPAEKVSDSWTAVALAAREGETIAHASQVVPDPNSWTSRALRARAAVGVK